MNRSFIVLGGVGAIGRVVVRDLFESNPRNRVLIADYNQRGAQAYAKSFRSRRISAAFADAGKPLLLAKLFRGHDVVVNCTQHDFNLHVMRAALLARVHYLDLGGLFHWTRKQLKLNPDFKQAGLTAILGSGCAPGITNVLSRYAASKLDRVDSIRIRVGAVDFNAKPTDFYFPYSAQTIVEELTLPPWVFRNGKFRQVPPRTGWERVVFPPPLGPLWTVCTRHSEVATLPLHLRLENCDFKVSFDRDFVRELVRRLRAGWTIQQLAKLQAPRGKPNDYEIARVVAKGKRAGKVVTLRLDCHAKPKLRWHASAGDVDTGCPPSIVAQMLADGIVVMRGVLAPEVAVPMELFFRELKRRGMKIVETEK